MRFFTDNGTENNNFERMERASFFLEQEKAELEEILLSYNNAKDEINEFLSKRVNLETVNPSGVIKYLQNILKETKLHSFNMNHLLDTGFYMIFFCLSDLNVF